ncbi:MAG: HlyD family efflux transporter periplasmic adaptor subunit [Rubrivivax sp.]
MSASRSRTVAPGEVGQALFRGEVAAHRSAQWLGPVLLAPRLSHRLLTAAAAAAAVAVVLLLFTASYTRTARLGGWLVPQQGVMRVLAPRPGVVTAVHVGEGAAVVRGQPLVTLSDELQTAALGGVQAEVARQLGGRRESLIAEREQQRRLHAQQQHALAERRSAMAVEMQQLGRELEVLGSRVAIARRNEALHREQLEHGFISEMRMQLVQAETLEQMARLGALKRSLTSLRREAAGVAAEAEALPLKQQQEAALLERALAQLGQERVEAEARREIVVPAPADGTVTAIQAVAGASAGSTVPLLVIVPAEHRLQAHLYGPSRAVGFARQGQRVVLRYEAFPYQRFGHHEGTVASISRTAVSPSDLPPSLSSLASPGTAGGSGAGEPLYRVVVDLGSQAVAAYGERLALQPGMTLEAEVSLERRRLYEWVLEPVRAMTGRWL